MEKRNLEFKKWLETSTSTSSVAGFAQPIFSPIRRNLVTPGGLKGISLGKTGRGAEPIISSKAIRPAKLVQDPMTKTIIKDGQPTTAYVRNKAVIGKDYQPTKFRPKSF